MTLQPNLATSTWRTGKKTPNDIKNKIIIKIVMKYTAIAAVIELFR